MKPPWCPDLGALSGYRNALVAIRKTRLRMASRAHPRFRAFAPACRPFHGVLRCRNVDGVNRPVGAGLVADSGAFVKVKIGAAPTIVMRPQDSGVSAFFAIIDRGDCYARHEVFRAGAWAVLLRSH